MTDDLTLSVTFTMHLTEPLTEKEKQTIIGNVWEHIDFETQEEVLGFAKIAEVYPSDEGARRKRAARRAELLRLARSAA